MRGGRLAACVAASALAVAGAWWAYGAAEDAGWFDAAAVPVPDDVARAMLRDLRRWDAARSGERRAVAERVERALADEGAGFDLVRVRPFGSLGHRREIAVFRHERTGLEFSLVPGGTFLMGSPESEEERAADETPHEVTLTSPFLIARTECTQAAYLRVMETNPSSRRAPDRPVEGVTWYRAAKFCKEAGLRLPTEAEWEYACRAGTTTRYWSGDSVSDLDEVGWTGDRRGRPSPWLRWIEDRTGRVARPPAGTRPVATMRANAFGLHDTHGNVWEWCADWWQDYPGGPATDPAGPASGWNRVRRGGSRGFPEHAARSAYRDWGDPHHASEYIGFRPARSVRP